MKRTIEKQSINTWVAEIKKNGNAAKNANLWHKVERMVSLPKRARVSVNLNKLSMFANDGDVIIVPGKVLGFGTITKKVKISAVEYSTSAVQKLKSNGCEMVDIDAMLKEKNPRLII